nr:hypothetical protein [Microlunatus soli]
MITPGQRDLPRTDAVRVGDRGQFLDQRLRPAHHPVTADHGPPDQRQRPQRRRVGMEPAGQDALPQRCVADQRDPQTTRRGEHAVGLDVSMQQVDLHLVAGHHQSVRTGPGLGALQLAGVEVADTDGSDPAGADQRGHRVDLRVDAGEADRKMDLMQVERISLQGVQPAADGPADARRGPPDRSPLAGDPNAPGPDTQLGQCRAERALGLPPAVHLGGVEPVDTVVQGGADDLGRGLLRNHREHLLHHATAAHLHAAQPDRGDLDPGPAELSPALHDGSLLSANETVMSYSEA